MITINPRQFGLNVAYHQSVARSKPSAKHALEPFGNLFHNCTVCYAAAVAFQPAQFNPQPSLDKKLSSIVDTVRARKLFLKNKNVRLQANPKCENVCCDCINLRWACNRSLIGGGRTSALCKHRVVLAVHAANVFERFDATRHGSNRIRQKRQHNQNENKNCNY